MWLKDLDKVPQSKSYRAFVQAISSAVEARAVAQGKAAGKAKGKAEAVLAVLEARGLAVSAEERARILGCTDLEKLERWVRRAVKVRATAELFAPKKRAAPPPR